MTLDAFPIVRRPGEPTTPQPLTGPFIRSGSGQAEAYQLQFLSAEEKSTAILMGYYTDARLELEHFIRRGDLTPSDAVYYRQLLDETNRLSAILDGKGKSWVSQYVPDAHSAGWRTFSSTVVSRGALDALSRGTLGLISQTTNGIRQTIRQAIAQGILQGLPAADVRSRILASGLTNIPHWPNVEYRAGVIARTETMRAYNAGALGGIESTGASFVRWIISPDEAVCPICAPRSRQVFRLPGVPIGGPNDPYGPAVRELPRLPAHPRCRCTIRAEYRGPDGNVIRGDVPDVDPKLPKDAMGGQEPPIVPLARGDFASSIARLTSYSPGGGVAEQAFWRGLGRFTDEEMTTLAGMKGSTGNAAWSKLLQFRYGITFGEPKGWTAALRLGTLQALEAVRAMAPRFVVDSSYLQFIGIRPLLGKRFGSNTLARAFASCHVEGNLSLMTKYLGKPLRAGVDGISTEYEVMVHEFMHTVHNRFGSQTQYGRFLPVEFSGPLDQAFLDFHGDWRRIRRATVGIVSPDSSRGDPVATLLKAIADVAVRRREAVAAGHRFVSFYDSQIATLQAQIAKVEKILAGEVGDMWPTEYAKQSEHEDFAESAMLYILNPSRLRKWSPARYEFLRDKVFGGIEA